MLAFSIYFFKICLDSHYIPPKKKFKKFVFRKIQNASTLKVLSKKNRKKFKLLTLPIKILKNFKKLFKVLLFCYIFWKKLKQFILDVFWIQVSVLAKLNKLKVKTELFTGLSKNFYDKKIATFFLGLDLCNIIFWQSSIAWRVFAWVNMFKLPSIINWYFNL